MALKPDAPAQIGDVARSAHQSGDQIVTFDLSGGIDRSRAPNEIPPNALRMVRNAYYPREAAMLRTRPGTKAWMTWGLHGSGRITAMYVYAKSATKSFLIMSMLNNVDPAQATGQYVYYIDLTAGAGNYSPVALNVTLLVTTAPPTFATMNGRLIIAAAGNYMYEWDGEVTAPNTTPASAVSSITVSSNPTAGDTVTVGERTFTFYSDAVSTRPGEVQIGANAEASASNLKVAIDRQCTQVRVTAHVGALISLEVRRVGTGGNSTTLETSSGGRVIVGTFSGGVVGAKCSKIDTYEAPYPAVILSDRNGRLVAAADTTYVNRVFFSAPGDPYAWRTRPWMEGQRWDIGYQEGNTIRAVVPFFDELWVHARGQNREIYRARIADPTPATWELQTRPHEEVHAAINPRCAATLGGKHLVVDTRSVLLYFGDDTYNEVRAEFSGARVDDLITYFYPGTAGVGAAFIAINPAEVYALVFPSFTDHCLCYHYGSDRWTTWKFSYNVSAAIYCEPLDLMLVATVDSSGNGIVHQLDGEIATDLINPNPTVAALDATRAFQTEIMTRTIDAGAVEAVHKQLMLDYTHYASGAAMAQIILNRDEQTPRSLQWFNVSTQLLLVVNATMTVYSMSATYFTGGDFSRIVSYETAVGEMLSYRLLHTGSLALNSMRARISLEGRAKR